MSLWRHQLSTRHILFLQEHPIYTEAEIDTSYFYIYKNWPWWRAKGHPWHFLFSSHISLSLSTTWSSVLFLTPSEGARPCPGLHTSEGLVILVLLCRCLFQSCELEGEPVTVFHAMLWVCMSWSFELEFPAQKTSTLLPGLLSQGRPASSTCISKTNVWPKGGCLCGGGCSGYKITLQIAKDLKKPR